MSVHAGPEGIVEIETPLSDADVESLKAGDRVRISGVIYTARDAAHARLFPLLELGQALPIDVRGAVIYYTGPTPPRPGDAIGSVGPTTASRMDTFTPALLKAGLKGTIGKGYRGQAVKDALQQYRAVYFGSIGGAGAVLAQFVMKAEIVAYADLGTEAIRRLEVAGFPAIVLNDCHGGDLYSTGQKQFARPQPA
jgi:fumarate hydratase subunit beta